MKNEITGFLLDFKNDFFAWFLEYKLLGLYLIFGSISTIVIKFISTYIFADFNYLIYLLIAMIIDSIAKVYNLTFIQNQKPSISSFIKKIIEKFTKYCCYLIIVFIVINFQVGGKKIDEFEVFSVYVYGVLIFKELVSVLKNTGMSLPKKLQDILDEKFDFNKDDK